MLYLIILFVNQVIKLNYDGKKKLQLQFSQRLVSALTRRGHISNNANSGVKVKELAKFISASSHMTRRFTLGQSMPDHYTIYKMAEFLSVSPGWLLFGEAPTNHRIIESDDYLHINQSFLSYILEETSEMLQSGEDKKTICSFIAELVHSVTKMEGNYSSQEKLFSLAVKSAKKFQQSTQASKEKCCDSIA